MGSHNVGFATFPIWSEEPEISMNLSEGSVRHLLSKTSKHPKYLSTIMDVQINTCPELRDIQQLFADSCIVGDSDELPGLKKRYLPYHYVPETEKRIKDIELDTSTKIHISGIKVQVEREIE